MAEFNEGSNREELGGLDVAVTIPSSPADRKKIRQLLDQISNIMSKIEFENETKKELVSAISKDFGIPKKHVNRMARTLHKRNYHEVQAEGEEFELLFESIVNGDTGSSE